MINMNNVYRETGLNIPANITEDDFFDIGVTLGRIARASQWQLGDWYNSIPWGDKKAACEKAGINSNTASVYSITCAVFPNVNNIRNLVFHKHQLLSNQKLTSEQRKTLVEKTQNEGWAGKALKIEINHVLGIEEPVAIVEFEKHGDEAIEVISTYMPKAASKKLTSAINREVKKLVKVVGHDFYSVVKKEVDLQVAKDRNRMKSIRDEAKAEKENYKRLTKGVQKIITEDEFKLIRSCLHPDKHGGDNRCAKAFEAFNRMADKFQ